MTWLTCNSCRRERFIAVPTRKDGIPLTCGKCRQEAAQREAMEAANLPDWVKEIIEDARKAS